MVTVKRSGARTPKPRVLVFLDPRGAFASVALRPLWGLGVVIALAFSQLPPIAYLSKADLPAFVERELKRSGKADQIPEAQRADTVTMGAKALRVLLPAGAATKRAMWMSVIGLLCFGLLRGQRPELRLSPVLGAAAFAMAPLWLHDVLVAATFLTKDVMAIDVQNAVLSNPAAWLGLETGHSPAAAALKGLDFFELWSCALVGIGVNEVAGTRSPVPWAVAFGLQGLTVAAGVATAALA